jgi:dihydroflavonol-4-reductase
MAASPNPDRRETTVLVTGASGFIGLHCVRHLLEDGYRVRGTLRTPSREARLRDALGAHVDSGDRLEFAAADLTRDEGWAEAVRGCTYVLHVASPFPLEIPKHEDELIVPARDGTLRVLQACTEAGVERVVLTSSLAAVLSRGANGGSRVFDEGDWPNAEDLRPYEKSKTIAERAAWDFANDLRGDAKLELAVINPGAVLGPILEEDAGTSAELVRKLMRREFPGCPRIGFPMVDVRDVASAHVAAMTTPEAAGQRFCCCVDFAWMSEIAVILKEHFADRGYRIPTRTLPDLAVRVFSLFDKTARAVVGNLGLRADISNERIKRVLGWKPHSVEEMVVATGESLIEHGVV